MTRSSLRTRARLSAGILAGAALVLAAPLAASAHIHVTPEESAAGTSTRLAFSFSHGCEDSPTTSVAITIPEGIDGVTPVLDGAWTISRDLGSDGIPTKVTFTAVNPVESGVSATVALDVIFASSAADTAVAFPIRQTCATGETDWSEVPAEGQSEDDLAAPAPVVAVGAVSAGGGHGHQSGDGDGDGDGDADGATDHGTDHAGGSDAGATAPAPDALPLWLSGGALAASVVALGIAITGRRRRD